MYLKARDYVELDVGTGAAVSITSNKCARLTSVCLSRLRADATTRTCVQTALQYCMGAGCAVC